MSEPERTIGYFAQVACTWEVLARKVGNVCPGREFPDLTVDDFLKSAAAIAPVLDQAPYQPLGVTILRCIEETRKVVHTNTNLGIVLLLAPLASVPLDMVLRVGIARALWPATLEDSRKVFAAIRIAKPGGLGVAQAQDVNSEPTLPLRQVMRLAMGRDLVAAQYALDFDTVLNGIIPKLVISIEKTKNIEHALVELQLQLLGELWDSLILRKNGTAETHQVRKAAREVVRRGGLDTPEGRQAYREFDTWLRSENHARNPGTTADLIAAALFVALRENKIPLSMPFVWEGHPFDD